MFIGDPVSDNLLLSDQLFEYSTQVLWISNASYQKLVERYTTRQIWGFHKSITGFS